MTCIPHVCSASHFVDVSMESDPSGAAKFFVVTGTDAAHCSGKHSFGVMLLLCMMDANRNTVLLVWGHFADNENEATWNALTGFVAACVPKLNVANVTVVRDGAASITNALNNHLKNARRLYCVKHASEASGREVRGAGIIKEYMYVDLALCCSVIDQQWQADHSTPVALKDYLLKSVIPDTQRLLASFATIGGHMDATLSDRSDSGNLAKVEPRHTNAFAESNMKAAMIDGSRFMPPVQMTIQTAITATRKMMAFAKTASESTAAVPPQVAKLLANLEAQAEKTQQTKVAILPGLVACAHVYPRLDLGNMNYLCNLNTKTCACGFPALTKFPCVCMAIMVKAIPHVQLLPLVDEQDRTTFWQEQYAFDFAACMLSKSNVWRGRATPLNMPGAIPRKAGRPPTARKKSALERLAGSGTAAARGAAGAAPARSATVYRCGKCGMPKKGHVCGGAPSGRERVGAARVAETVECNYGLQQWYLWRCVWPRCLLGLLCNSVEVVWVFAKSNQIKSGLRTSNQIQKPHVRGSTSHQEATYRPSRATCGRRLFRGPIQHRSWEPDARAPARGGDALGVGPARLAVAKGQEERVVRSTQERQRVDRRHAHHTRRGYVLVRLGNNS